MSIELYEQASKKYKPKEIKILFIAESPPYAKKGEELRYFYFENTKGDFLFRSIIEVLFPEEYQKHTYDKTKFLKLFKENGFFLIDACEYPINQNSARDKFIKDDFDKLVNKIRNLVNLKTKIILIKKNIYELLFDRLNQQGFNVINKEHLDFPSHGHQPKFKEKLKKLLKEI